MFWKLLLINGLTLIRLIGTLFLIPLYNHYGGFFVGIFALFCYLTDSVDGALARHWKASTFFGAIFDAISDKLLTIINFIILFLITPYSLIPIIFEILTLLIVLIKYNRHYNAKSNIIGKAKVWVLAICIVLTFIISDPTHIPLLSDTYKNILITSSKDLYFYLLLPAIIIEALTFISYVLELFEANTKDKDEKIVVDVVSNGMKERVKKVWFNPEFYDNHKNDSNLKDLRKLTKK